MKFKIHWIEYRYCETIKQEKEYLTYLPIGSKISGELMGDTEFECSDSFEANTIEEAKIISRNYECGEHGVFAVVDETGKTLFTEQDL